MKLYRLHLRKEALKFAAAHMTVFPDGTKEPLHGHNYRTELAVDLADASLTGMVPFSAFKDALRAICRGWDERVLLPQRCPFLTILSRDEAELAFTLCGKRYVLPADEVAWIDADNVTAETLAEACCARLLATLPQQVRLAVRGLQVRIDEITGQGATFVWSP